MLTAVKLASSGHSSSSGNSKNQMCDGQLTTTVKNWLLEHNFVYEDESVANQIKNEIEDCWNRIKDNIKSNFRILFYIKLKCEIRKFIEHKNGEEINDNDYIYKNQQNYKFNILFNENIKNDKIVGKFDRKNFKDVYRYDTETTVTNNVKEIYYYSLENFLKTELNRKVEDIKNDNDVSNEKIFNLIVFLIDIIEYYKLTYDYKKVIKEILSTSPKETSYLIFSADINEESLTKYVAKNYKTGEYQKYLPLIFNEEPKPAADGRRKSKRRSKKRSKRRSSRRKSKRRSKKSKKRY